MTPAEADRLAQKFKKAWPNGPHPEVWAEELTECHFGQAEAAYRIMVREDDRPSIGKFFGIYRGLATERDEDRIPPCGTCGSTGWVSVEEVHKGHTYSMAKPCWCPRGKDLQGTHRKIVADNEAVFDRLQPGRHVKPLEPDSRGLDF